MGTGELTKAEESHIERSAEASFGQPTMKERFEEWAGRTISDAKANEKEHKKSRSPREISLEDRTPEEREFIKAVAEKPSDHKKESAKESGGKEGAARTEQTPKERESGKTDAKASERSGSESSAAPAEPIVGDRYWEAKSDGKAVDSKTIEKHWQDVDRRAGVALQFIESHPQKQQIADGLQTFFAGKSNAWREAFSADLFTALAEVASPGEVLRHIALQPEDREILRNSKSWKELRANIHTLAKLYPAKASQANSKPRAPKPPSEVGGRGAAPDDSTRNADNFSSFSDSMNRRYARR